MSDSAESNKQPRIEKDPTKPHYETKQTWVCELTEDADNLKDQERKDCELSKAQNPVCDTGVQESIF